MRPRPKLAFIIAFYFLSFLLTWAYFSSVWFATLADIVIMSIGLVLTLAMCLVLAQDWRKK